MLSERLGKWHFWLFLIGFHLTFDFMHVPGLLGMPRRIYTYEADRGWMIWNMIVSSGAVFQAIATVIFVYNMVWSYFKGDGCRALIRGMPGLWSGRRLRRHLLITLPKFQLLSSRRPLWDLKHPEDPDSNYEMVETSQQQSEESVVIEAA